MVHESSCAWLCNNISPKFGIDFFLSPFHHSLSIEFIGLLANTFALHLLITTIVCLWPWRSFETGVRYASDCRLPNSRVKYRAQMKKKIVQNACHAIRNVSNMTNARKEKRNISSKYYVVFYMKLVWQGHISLYILGRTEHSFFSDSFWSVKRGRKKYQKQKRRRRYSLHWCKHNQRETPMERQ